MKSLRKLAIPLLSILIILTSGLWLLSITISPTKVSNYVSTQLTALTSLPTHVNGAISWQIFPQPRIKMTAIQIGENPNQDPFNVKLDKLFINLKFMPLLRGNLEFSSIKVDGFSIQINEKGSSHLAKTIPPSDSQSIQQIKVKNIPAIDRLLLSHGQAIFFHNGDKLTFSGLQVAATQINLQESPFPFQLKSSMAFSNSTALIAKANIQFKGSTSLSPALFNHPAIDSLSRLFNGQVIIQNAHIDKFKITKLSANTQFKDAILTLNPLTIALYQGESVGDLRYNLVQKTLKINQTASNINSARLTQDLFNKKLLRGNLDLSLHANTSLQAENWLNTLIGEGHFTMKDGSIESVNLNKVIEVTSSQINALLLGKTANTPSLEIGSFDDPAFFKGGTPFKLVTLQYHLANAHLYSDAFFLQTDLLRLKGDGDLNLNDYEINNRFLATVIITEKKVEEIQKLLGGAFPLIVKGTITKPQVLPDLKKINPILTQLWLSNTLTKPVKKIKEQLVSIFH